MEAVTIRTAEVDWQELTGFPGKGDVKILRDEGGSSARTLIVRIPPGGQIIPHAHQAAVQHFLLEGEYESEGVVYAAGTYRLLPGHANVAPVSTQKGATILFVYDPVT